MRWQPYEVRFWNNVDKDGPRFGRLGKCWLWTGGCDSYGYGRIWAMGKSWKAHQLSLFIVGRTAPEGTEPDHLCRNPACVRPSHLEYVEHRTNLLRGRGIAAVNASRKRCPKGHQYKGANLIITKKGKRECRTCRRQNDRASYARRKAAA